jgi:DNA-binding response OmpR family regulator
MSGLYSLNELEGLQCTPDDFMTKPFKMDVLLEKIEKLLNKKKITGYDIN